MKRWLGKLRVYWDVGDKVPRLCAGCRFWGNKGEEGEFRTCMAIPADEQYAAEDIYIRADAKEEAHWRENGEKFFADLAAKESPEYVSTIRENIDEELAEIGKRRRFREQHKAMATTGGSLACCAATRTRQDFGCVLWEDKAS